MKKIILLKRDEAHALSDPRQIQQVQGVIAKIQPTKITGEVL